MTYLGHHVSDNYPLKFVNDRPNAPLPKNIFYHPKLLSLKLCIQICHLKFSTTLTGTAINTFLVILTILTELKMPSAVYSQFLCL